MSLKLNKGLIKGSLVLLIAFNIYNLFNFIFQFSMVRMLSVSDYGILATLFSIIYFLGVFTESIQTIITKYTAKEENKGKLKNILKKSLKKAYFISSILFLVYLLAAIPLSSLLKIDYPLIALNGLMIFITFFVPINRGILQGRKRFFPLGVNMIAESTIKLILAVVLAFIGWKVYGAMLGVILGVSIAFALSFFNIGDIIRAKEEKAETDDIYGYSKPTFLILLTVFIFYGIDIIIAKIFFPAEIAGSYAIASILAKTIFFGTQPIGRAMFPLSVENKSEKGKSENVFSNALIILLLIIIAALALFYFFPEMIIKIFSGKDIPEATSILFYIGIAIGLFSLANLILLYKLSVGRIRGYWVLFVFIAIEVFLLSYFSKNLFQFSIAFITSAAMFLWAAVVLIRE